MDFIEDEIDLDKTTYVLLKVPLSVLKALIERESLVASDNQSAKQMSMKL